MADRSEYALWLPDEEYAKAVGQARLQFNGVFDPFHLYGLNVYIPGAIVESMTI